MSTRTWDKNEDSDKYIGAMVLYRMGEGEAWRERTPVIRRYWQESMEELRARVKADILAFQAVFPQWEVTSVLVTRMEGKKARYETKDIAYYGIDNE